MSRRRVVRLESPTFEGKVLPRKECRINKPPTLRGRWRWNVTITGQSLLWCVYGAIFLYSTHLELKKKRTPPDP